jgi:hypothetical protein
MCDIFQAVKHYRAAIHWEGLKYKAEKYGIISPLYTTLFIVKEFIGKQDGSMDDALRGFASEDLDKELVWLFNKRILYREDKLPFVPGSFIKILAASRFKAKAKALLKSIFPDTKTISHKYKVPRSSNRLYLYYLVHPFSLLLKAKNIIVQTARVKEDTILYKWVNGEE